MSEKTISTDVLVIGGGLAGCFSAVRAREMGADVVLADKNYVGKTGSSHFARDFMVFNEAWGDSLKDWTDQFSRIGEYVADRNWDEILLKESYHRYLDLMSWGEPFYRKDCTSGFPTPTEEPWRSVIRKTEYRYTNLIAKFGSRQKMMIARRKVESSGCKILDRVMITELIKKEGRVVGAVGFNTTTGDFYYVKAKAVIIASGGISYKSAAYGIQFNAGDGMAMAYNVGAELISLEFGQGMYVVKDVESVVIDGPVSEIGTTRDVATNAEGVEFLKGFPQVPTNILWAIEFHKGRGPIYHEAYGVDRAKFAGSLKRYDETAEGPWITMLDRAGLDIFHDKFEEYMAFEGSFFTGGIRVNTKLETRVPGLYAAGDAAGTNYSGTNYAALGSGMCHASVTGYRAGQNAAKYAKERKHVELPAEEIAGYREAVFAPLKRLGGFKPEHVLARIQQNILPYEMHMVMHGDRLWAAITLVEFFRRHWVPKLKAADTHDLRNAHEVKTMALGAEISLKAAAMRTESRGWFYREDYPHRDDANWLKWIVAKDEGGEIRLYTTPVPEESHGDKTLPYDKRYPMKYQER